MDHELLARYKHIQIREKRGWTHIIMGRQYKRICSNCRIEADENVIGLEATWGVRQFFFCRVCAFTKYQAIELFAKLAKKSPFGTESTGPQ